MSGVPSEAAGSRCFTAASGRRSQLLPFFRQRRIKAERKSRAEPLNYELKAPGERPGRLHAGSVRLGPKSKQTASREPPGWALGGGVGGRGKPLETLIRAQVAGSESLKQWRAAARKSGLSGLAGIRTSNWRRGCRFPARVTPAFKRLRRDWKAAPGADAEPGKELRAGGWGERGGEEGPEANSPPAAHLSLGLWGPRYVLMPP